ncbi:MAG: hypothetical protein ACK4GC_11430 [Paracoccaceae bacterium]
MISGFSGWLDAVLAPFSAHGVTFQLDAVGVVDDTVGDGIGALIVDWPAAYAVLCDHARACG